MIRTGDSEYNVRTRPKPLTFYPPKTSPFWVGVAKLWLRRALRRQLRVTKVEISDDDLNRLRQLKGLRCLVTPSHSGGFEPHIIMHLSKLTNDIYNYVAAVEVFEQAPLNRWLMPRLGVYSIIRGAVDRPSFAMTRQLLADGKRWLVVFPEGHAILQNSTLAPFQQGVIQLAFKGFEDAQAINSDASLHCVPIAIKYVYLDDMHDAIDESLDRLAAALSPPKSSPSGRPVASTVELGQVAAGDSPWRGEGVLNSNSLSTSTSRYDRLRQTAEAVLLANEKVHHVKSDPGASMNDRLQNLKSCVAANIERQLGITGSDRQTPLDRVRAMFNAVDHVIYNEPPASEYEQRLALEKQQLARTLYDDIWRLLQFVAIYDGYVRESMTVERFMDVLGLLELEVFQTRRVWGPRKACVKVGEPIDLKNFADAYEKNKRDAVQSVTTTLESSVRKHLDAMEANCALVRE